MATDSTTGTEASYVIISLTNETAIISGVMPFTQDVAGMAIDLDIEIEMILEKQWRKKYIETVNREFYLAFVKDLETTLR